MKKIFGIGLVILFLILSLDCQKGFTAERGTRNVKGIKSQLNRIEQIGREEYSGIQVQENQSLDNSAKITIWKNRSLKKAPKLFILAIGISKYKFGFDNPKDYSPEKGIILQNLSYADNDAIKLSEILKKRGHSLFSEVKLLKLINNQATNKNIILEGFKKFLKGAGRDDVILIFMAGHAQKEGKRYYYITYDTDPTNLDGLGIRDTLLAEKINDLKKDKYGQRIVLIVDTCHAGALQQHAFNIRSGNSELTNLADRIKDYKGFYLFAASSSDESSLDSIQGEKNGAFTSSLLEAMEIEDNQQMRGDENRDGLLTLNEWFTYSANNLPYKAYKADGEQRPVEKVMDKIQDMPIALAGKINIEQFYGFVTINAIPWGKITIGTFILDEETPVIKKKIPVGIHDVIIRKEGYQTFKGSIEVEKEKTIRLSHKFKR